MKIENRLELVDNLISGQGRDVGVRAPGGQYGGDQQQQEANGDLGNPMV